MFKEELLLLEANIKIFTDEIILCLNLLQNNLGVGDVDETRLL